MFSFKTAVLAQRGLE